jgi:hypothetical protein
MGQRELGQAYFNTLSAIKDKIASNLMEESGKIGLTKDQIRRIVFLAQASVDDVGGSAFTSLTKSTD